jgi:hypothetical protein
MELGGCLFHPMLGGSAVSADSEGGLITEEQCPLPAPVPAIDSDGFGYGDCLRVITESLALRGLELPPTLGPVPSLQDILAGMKAAVSVPCSSPALLPDAQLAPMAPDDTDLFGVNDTDLLTIEDTFPLPSQWSDFPPSLTQHWPITSVGARSTPAAVPPSSQPTHLLIKMTVVSHGSKQPRITNQLHPLWNEDLQCLGRECSEWDKVEEQHRVMELDKKQHFFLHWYNGDDFRRWCSSYQSAHSGHTTSSFRKCWRCLARIL